MSPTRSRAAKLQDLRRQWCAPQGRKGARERNRRVSFPWASLGQGFLDHTGRSQLTVDTVRRPVYTRSVIEGFRHKGLEEIHFAGKTRRIGPDYVRKCLRIMQLLDVAVRPEELNIAGFRFHGLKGSPPRWSVRVTANYRITFGWSGDNAVDVDLEDYH